MPSDGVAVNAGVAPASTCPAAPVIESAPALIPKGEETVTAVSCLLEFVATNGAEAGIAPPSIWTTVVTFEPEVVTSPESSALVVAPVLVAIRTNPEARPPGILKDVVAPVCKSKIPDAPIASVCEVSTKSAEELHPPEPVSVSISPAEPEGTQPDPPPLGALPIDITSQNVPS